MGGAGATNIIPFCSCLGFSLQAAGKHGNTKQAEGKAFDMEMIWGKKAEPSNPIQIFDFLERDFLSSFKILILDVHNDWGSGK